MMCVCTRRESAEERVLVLSMYTHIYAHIHERMQGEKSRFFICDEGVGAYIDIYIFVYIHTYILILIHRYTHTA
jgi:hypothetical protein